MKLLEKYRNQTLVLSYLLIVISLAAYILLAWFTKREEFVRIVVLQTILFTAFVGLLVINKSIGIFKILLFAAVGFRLVWIFAMPELSNDYFRFIWDGELINHGYNPYLYLPIDFIQTDAANEIIGAQALYEGMGNLSQQNHTCYPPVNQLFYSMSAFVFPGNIQLTVVVMRLFIIAAEIGTIWVGIKILQKLKLPSSNILLYALNPFVILELTGNLHFEAIMIFFLLAAIYLLMNERILYSALLIALSISIKLLPLIFLPILFKKIKMGKKSIVLFHCRREYSTNVHPISQPRINT